MSATVPTGLDLETLELTLEPIDEFAPRELPDSVVIALDQRDEFPEELVRRMRGEGLDIQLPFVGTEAMRWVAGTGESGGVEQLAARFGLPAIQSAQAGLVADLFAAFHQRARELIGGREGGLAPTAEPVVITGAACGLPGAEKLFGKVRGRLEGYRTIEPGAADADALAPIRAAMGS